MVLKYGILYKLRLDFYLLESLTRFCFYSLFKLIQHLLIMSDNVQHDNFLFINLLQSSIKLTLRTLISPFHILYSALVVLNKILILVRLRMAEVRVRLGVHSRWPSGRSSWRIGRFVIFGKDLWLMERVLVFFGEGLRLILHTLFIIYMMLIWYSLLVSKL